MSITYSILFCSKEEYMVVLQFSSVTQLCLTLCDTMDCTTPGLPAYHQLPELTQTHVHWLGDAISSSVIPFSSCPQSFLASGSFPMSQLFTSGGPSIGLSASTSVLPMNTQDWSPLGWTGWIASQSRKHSQAEKSEPVTGFTGFHHFSQGL